MSELARFGCMVISVVLLLVGCSSSSQFKYGKLYTMQEVLSVADGNCSDKKARERAINWAVHGIQDLKGSRTLLSTQSDEYKKNRLLMNNLMLLTSRRDVGAKQFCENIKQARQATDDFLLSANEADYATLDAR